MRVAIVGDYPLNDSQIWGGEQAAFSYLVRELCRINDLQVHVLTPASFDVAGQVRVEENGATLHLLPPFPRFELFRRYRTYQAHLDDDLTQIRPDVVHAQGATHHGYVALGSGYPAVITVHGVQSEDCRYQSSFYLRARKWLVGVLIERYNLSHTRHLVAISRYVTNYFSTLFRPDVRVYYVPNAIDGSFFDLENTSDGQTILFAGRIIQRKRPLDLIRAFAKVAQQVPSAELRLAGEYDSERDYAESIHNFIQRAKLEDRVHLLGSLPEDAVLREFASCALLVLPSSQETTPMVVAQAMAAGKPAVATPVGGVAEMVNHGKTGFLVSVGDIDALADALLRLLKDPSLQTRLGQSGRRFAVENYRADNVARRTYDVYRSMVAAGG